MKQQQKYFSSFILKFQTNGNRLAQSTDTCLLWGFCIFDKLMNLTAGYLHCFKSSKTKDPL